eukprot:3934672-Rhodomonas_salina.1
MEYRPSRPLSCCPRIRSILAGPVLPVSASLACSVFCCAPLPTFMANAVSSACCCTLLWSACPPSSSLPLAPLPVTVVPGLAAAVA